MNPFKLKTFARSVLTMAFICLRPLCGQAPPPPIRPAIFGAGIISGPANDTSPAFSPDGNTVYFTRGGAVMESSRRDGQWSKPEIASFSGQWRDCEPALSPDGLILIFASSRPAKVDGVALDGKWGGQVYKGQGGNLWCVKRQGQGWGSPERLSELINRSTAIFAPAVVNDYSLYFMEATMTTKFRLYRSQYKNGTYHEPEALSFSDSTWSDVDPAVAPDESFMVFPSTRPPAANKNHELFIVFQKNGHWGEPRNLGPEVNDASSDQIEARLGPNHATLYFSSDRVIPVDYPRTRDAAKQDLKLLEEWNDGLLNIWQVDLSPWLSSPH